MGTEVWADTEHTERLAKLPNNRRQLVRGYARRYAAAEVAGRHRRDLGRELTDEEERIGALLALDFLQGK